ncbi:Uncharacterised protein [Klebsiella pneumoniae]|nr:Uncharacterised protein [Klebsiella pneumoniae]
MIKFIRFNNISKNNIIIMIFPRHYSCSIIRKNNFSFIIINFD